MAEPPAPRSYAATMLAVSKHAAAEKGTGPPRKSAALREIDIETEDEEDFVAPQATAMESDSPRRETAAPARSGTDMTGAPTGIRNQETRNALQAEADGDNDADDDDDADDDEEEDGEEDCDAEDDDEDDDDIDNNIIISAPQDAIAQQQAAAQRMKANTGPGAASSHANSLAGEQRNAHPLTTNNVVDPPGGPYQCPHCVKKFSLKGNREKHVRAIHLLIRAFVCPICGHSSSYKRNLDRHVLNVHHRLKPFHCPDCMRSFSQKTNIRTHLKLVHGVERPFPRPHPCRQCHMAFDTKARLRQHTTTQHHGKVAWRCTLCGKGYKWRRSLRKHMAQKHLIGNLASNTIAGMVIETPNSGVELSKIQPAPGPSRVLGTDPEKNAEAAAAAASASIAAAAACTTVAPVVGATRPNRLGPQEPNVSHAVAAAAETAEGAAAAAATHAAASAAAASIAKNAVLPTQSSTP